MEHFWFPEAIMLEILQMVTGPVKRKVGRLHSVFSFYLALFQLYFYCESEIIRASQIQPRLKDAPTWNET